MNLLKLALLNGMFVATSLFATVELEVSVMAPQEYNFPVMRLINGQTGKAEVDGLFLLANLVDKENTIFFRLSIADANRNFIVLQRYELNFNGLSEVEQAWGTTEGLTFKVIAKKI